jgi:hypothetical protein
MTLMGPIILTQQLAHFLHALLPVDFTMRARTESGA